METVPQTRVTVHGDSPTDQRHGTWRQSHSPGSRYMDTIPQPRASSSLSTTVPLTTHLLVSPSLVSSKERDLGKDGGSTQNTTLHKLLGMQTEGGYREQTQLCVSRSDKKPPDLKTQPPVLPWEVES